MKTAIRLLANTANSFAPGRFRRHRSGSGMTPATLDIAQRISRRAHGDFAEVTEYGGLVIHGRSDSVLNPGGVRIGTAEIYRQVEKLDEVVESIAIGQNWNNDVRVVLFVVLQDGVELNDELVERIRKTVRENTTPRHVPAKIISVPEIPRTRSGKIVELAVRSVVHGEEVSNTQALANPDALEYYRGLPQLET